MDITLLKEGCTVMVIGMGTVFLFLTVMILVMEINSRFIKILNKYFPEEIPQEKTGRNKKPSLNDEEIAVAIACAINQARKA